VTATFFKNALLVELDPPTVAAGCLRQVDGQIVAVGAEVVAAKGDETVDCRGAVLMPGLVNGHTHVYSALAAGMPAPARAPRDFHEILQFIWWRLDRAHTLESVGASGQIGALAALRCGTTTLVDHHASPNAIDGSLSALEEGVAQVGCRGVFCYETTDRNSGEEASQGLNENRRYAGVCQEAGQKYFAAMVGAHASFTMSEDSLAQCADLARQLGVGVHIHVAEDPVDERITRERYGCGLIERFARHRLLEVEGSIFAHGTHLSVDDRARLAEHATSVTLAHNPNSNMNNGVGYTPVVKWKQPVMLGTDGIGADLWREARVAQFKSADVGLRLPAGHSLKMLAESARFASRCLGVELGTLEVGAAADLVLTDYRPATPLCASNLADHFLYVMGAEFIRRVMIDGRWCLADGQVLTCDEPAIRAAAVEVSRSLFDRMDRS